MEASTQTVGKWTVLTVTGRIDAHTSPALEEACRAQLAKGATWLALDLAGVPYMSSAGLRVLLTTLKAVTGASGDITLIGAKDNVREVLDVSGFLRLFTVADAAKDLS